MHGSSLWLIILASVCVSSKVVNDVLNALGDVIDVLRGNSADRDTTVLSHINAMFLDHGLALFDGQAREREHADLGRDMGPVSLDLLLLKGSAEGVAHVVHPGADDDELIEPLLAHLGVVEDGSRNSGTVLGW